MENTKQKEIEETIANPMTKDMKPWQEALSKTMSKSGQEKIDSNQISTWLDKRENKIAHKRKPEA